MDAATCYAMLATLQVNEVAPCYIADYADGQRPRWVVVVERTEIGAGGARIILHDRENADLFSCAQVIVLTFPNKTLRTPPHLSDAGSAIAGPLCDLLQQARYAEKQKIRKARR